ncbi:MAG: hypothetical protein GX234_02575 [Clostridiales bacterium]|nr:hypothetical protein [Clostridiales bacterium]
MKNRVVVGYDLNDEYAQISYLVLGEKEPETVSVVAGSQLYNIPAVLCKRSEVNQWFYGKEALKAAEAGEGILVTQLLSRALGGEEVEVGEEKFDAVAILALFLKRSLSLLHFSVAPEQIEAFVITVDELNRNAIEVLEQAASALSLKHGKVYLQSHMESFYHYVIHQPQELWNQQVGLFDFSGSYMKTYRLECNRRTTPMVAFIDTQDYPGFSRNTTAGADNSARYAEWDGQLAQAAEKMTQGRIVSTIYLIGEGFDGGWSKQSLKQLCLGRRVFQGNNLYSKGACYGAREKLEESEIEKQYVFLGNEKLKANVGMQVVKRGEDAYFALIDAGYNWFEVEKECEFILESGNSFEILVTPLTGGKPKSVEIVLEGLPRRERGTTRLHMNFRPVGEKRIQIRAEDLGFGDIVPATHQIWQEEFEI